MVTETVKNNSTTTTHVKNDNDLLEAWHRRTLKKATPTKALESCAVSTAKECTAHQIHVHPTTCRIERQGLLIQQELYSHC
eukprot:m.555394 g.555394  ORF g.555394 m.555394 type:complete len:81 (+) comp22181_c0_seq32:944-1186(+)